MGRRFCEDRECPDYFRSTAKTQRGYRSRKYLCRRTGYMPGHMKRCPRESDPEQKDVKHA